jgi:2-keto-3-deoxy-L-rhamnonate aldolase RhmA
MKQLRAVLKARLASRDFIIGIAPKFPSADLVAALSPRFDYVFIDCENAGPDVERIPDLVRAAHSGGAAALLRPWSKDAGVLRRYLG